MENDTIVAVATAVGEGAIAIIRISGSNSFQIIDNIFFAKHLKRLSNVQSHTIHYGHIIDPINNQVIDEVMVNVFRNPKTFTREDVIEINCHGGMVTVNSILHLILQQGARLAEPGEFTKRAFLNGRIDLSQAEAVSDLIRAKTDKAMLGALAQVSGQLASLIRSLRNNLIETLAQIEVAIDYPEYDDVTEVSYQMLLTSCKKLKREITNLLSIGKKGKIFREGLSVALIGRPNVGKSSLLNWLTQTNRAIVTDIPGTTRDIIEEMTSLCGIPIKVLDTAGIRKTDDPIEKIGVNKSHTTIAQADLVILVLNYAEPLNDQDYQLLNLLKDKPSICLINKIDLPSKIDLSDPILKGYKKAFISTYESKGLKELEEIIEAMFISGETTMQDFTYIANARQVDLLEQAIDSIKDAEASAIAGVPIDIIQIDLKKCWELLGEIIGENVHEDLIDHLFSNFCLGK